MALCYFIVRGPYGEIMETDRERATLRLKVHGRNNDGNCYSYGVGQVVAGPFENAQEQRRVLARYLAACPEMRTDSGVLPSEDEMTQEEVSEIRTSLGLPPLNNQD